MHTWIVYADDNDHKDGKKRLSAVRRIVDGFCDPKILDYNDARLSLSDVLTPLEF